MDLLRETRDISRDEIATREEADQPAFQRERYLDKLRGSMLGGAVEDALGCPVDEYSRSS